MAGRSLKLARDASRKATIKGAVKKYDSGDLEDKLGAYIRHTGVEHCFDFGPYKSMPATFAVRGRAVVALEPLVRTILEVTPALQYLIQVYCILWF